MFGVLVDQGGYGSGSPQGGGGGFASGCLACHTRSSFIKFSLVKVVGAGLLGFLLEYREGGEGGMVN